MRRIGENVRFYRNLRGLTQTALARLVQVAPAYISQIEANQRVPSLKVTRRIADVLGLEMSVLLRETEAASPEGRLTKSETLDLLRTLILSIESERAHPDESDAVVRNALVDCTELASEPAFGIVLRTFHARAPLAGETPETTMECHVVLQGRVVRDYGATYDEWTSGQSFGPAPAGGAVAFADPGSRVLSVYGPRADLVTLAEFPLRAQAREPNSYTD